MRKTYSHIPDAVQDLSDEEYEKWTANLVKFATENAEKLGLTQADLEPVLKSQEQWRTNRAKADLAEEKAAIAKAKAEEAGQNYLNALAEHTPDDELPN